MVWVQAINFGEVPESVLQTHFMEKDELKQLRALIWLSALKCCAAGAKLSVGTKPGSSLAAGELWLLLPIAIWPCASFKVPKSPLFPAASHGSRHQWLCIGLWSSSCVILKPCLELIWQCIVAWCSEVTVDGVGLEAWRCRWRYPVPSWCVAGKLHHSGFVHFELFSLFLIRAQREGQNSLSKPPQL